MNRLQLILASAALVLAAVVIWVLVALAPHKPGEGILCDSMEGKALHIHVQLQLWKDGQPIPIPAGVGITADCTYWVHTHTSDGILHVESPEVRDFTLGDFFAVWAVNPWGGAGSVSQVKGLVLWGKKAGEAAFHPVSGRWWEHVLSAHEVLALGTGTFVPQDFTFPKDL